MTVVLVLGGLFALLLGLVMAAMLFLSIKFLVLTAVLITQHYAAIKIGLKVAKEVKQLWR